MPRFPCEIGSRDCQGILVQENAQQLALIRWQQIVRTFSLESDHTDDSWPRLERPVAYPQAGEYFGSTSRLLAILQHPRRGLLPTFVEDQLCTAIAHCQSFGGGQ